MQGVEYYGNRLILTCTAEFPHSVTTFFFFNVGDFMSKLGFAIAERLLSKYNSHC